MNKGKILGIIGGISLFLIILFIINYGTSDFDQKLINEVEMNTSSQDLIPLIKKETFIEKTNAKRHLESHVMDMKYWSKTNIDPQDDLEYYTQIYEQQIAAISEYEKIRIQYVKKEINKEQFLLKIKELKPKLNV